MTKKEFIAAASAAALACSRTSGLPAGVTVAQAALESAWGRSQLARLANNYFGIKAYGGKPSLELPTVEVLEGQARRIKAGFARYNSMAECFSDRDRLILKMRCYAEARACAAEPLRFIEALARHWATDPHYAERLQRVYLENGLNNLDV